MAHLKVSLSHLRKLKAENIPAVGVSCYTAPDAVIAAEAGVDFIVVGDSLAMTLLGYDSTLPATMEMMELFTAAVYRGLSGQHLEKTPLIVGDMPLGSYQPSNSIAVTNACRLAQAGADIVKIEGSSPLIQSRIKAITQAGIGVVAHLGLQPQQKALVGGWRVQGKTAHEANVLLDEIAMTLRAGAAIVLLEAVPKEVPSWLCDDTQWARMGEDDEPPELLYGIGAGNAVDGQLLVLSDLVGEFRPFKSRFAKRYVETGALKLEAVKNYAAEVRSRSFPNADTSYSMAPEELEKLK